MSDSSSSVGNDNSLNSIKSTYSNDDIASIPATGSSLFELFNVSPDKNNKKYSCRVNDCCSTVSGGTRMLEHANDHVQNFPAMLNHIHQFQYSRKKRKLNDEKSEEISIKLNESITKLIVALKLPFRIVEDDDFLKFIEEISTIGKNYHHSTTDFSSLINSRKNFRNKLIPQYCTNIWNIYSEKAERSMVHHGATLMLDGRKNINKSPLISIGIHSRMSYLHLDSIDTKMHKADKIYYEELAKKYIMKYAGQIFSFCIDNAAVGISAAYNIQQKYNVQLIKCQCHSINLLGKHIFNEVKIIKEFTNDLFIVVDFFRSTTKISQLQKHYCNSRIIFRHVPTRFGSIFIVINRVLDIFDDLKLCIESKEIEKLTDLELINEKRQIFNDKFRELLNILNEIGRIILRFLRMFDRMCTDISLVYYSWCTTISSIAAYFDLLTSDNFDIPQLKKEILIIVHRDMEKYYAPAFGASFLINHQLKHEVLYLKLHDKKLYNRLLKDFRFCVTKILRCRNPSLNELNLNDSIKKIEIELSDFLCGEVYMDDAISPLRNWRSKTSGNLPEIASILLSMQVSTSNTERTHKINRDIHSKSRNRLSIEAVDQLVQGNIAYQMLKRQDKLFEDDISKQSLFKDINSLSWLDIQVNNYILESENDENLAENNEDIDEDLWEHNISRSSQNNAYNIDDDDGGVENNQIVDKDEEVESDDDFLFESQNLELIENSQSQDIYSSSSSLELSYTSKRKIRYTKKFQEYLKNQININTKNNTPSTI